MTDPLQRWREEYWIALQGYLSGTGEGALHDAYELGRRALVDGLGILDMASLHHDALALLLSRSEAFYIESLSPFEMSHRAVGEANAALRSLNQILEDEATRIAHALHDEAGSLLASTQLALNKAARRLPAREQDSLLEVRNLLDQTGEQLRHLSHELRPSILDDLGLRPALEYLAQGVAQRTGLAISVDGELRESLGSATETAVYRIVQEALNNAARHARATSVAVKLAQQPEQLRCTVEDNGIGFDAVSVLARKGAPGLGLTSMRDRIGAVGGSMNILSTPGQGTTIEILISLESRDVSQSLAGR